jgi:hypothetical protein
MASEMIRWNLFMPVDLMEKTKKLALKRHISSADVVRAALIAYLAAVEKAESRTAVAVESANVA